MTLPHGVTDIRTEFYFPEPPPLKQLQEAEWREYGVKDDGDGAAHDALAFTERLEQRGREGQLQPEELGMLGPLCPQGWVPLRGKFWRHPGRSQAAGIEELPRRASYHGATVERITVWAKMPFTGQERARRPLDSAEAARFDREAADPGELHAPGVCITKPETIRLPATMHDYRELDRAEASWTVTLFGTSTVTRSWMTVAELEPEFERIPLAQVGTLPGDEPAPFREALGKAQWRCAETRKQLQLLQGQETTSITTSRGEQQQLKLRAAAHLIDADGVLCRVGVEGVARSLPAVPAVRIGAELPEEWRGDARHRDKTGRHMFLHHSHRSLPRAHAPVEEMKNELNTLVFWGTVDRDIESWCENCRMCKSRSLRGRLSSVLTPLTQVRPHAVLVIDMTFVTPRGLDGEIGVLSAICIATELVWFRPILGKTEWDAGWALYAIVMNSAVVPIEILSDRDGAFRSKMIREFTALMGIKQGFSLAWPPESHGIVEHAHYEMNQATGKSLETLAQTKLAMWPPFLPGSENKRRTRTLPSGHSPTALSRGHYATTTLQTTMAAIRAIPSSLPLYDFMRGIVATHKRGLRDEMEDRAERRAVVDVARNLNARVRPRMFDIGEQVLITHPKDIRAGHKLRGAGYGPWKVSAVLNDCVELTDAVTGRQLMDIGTGPPDRINVDHLRKWRGDVESLEAQGLDGQMTLSNLQVGSYVAILDNGGMYVLKVTSYEENETVIGYPMSGPQGEQHGATVRRPWMLHDEVETIAIWSSIACQVAIDAAGCLTRESVDRTRAIGLGVDQE